MDYFEPKSIAETLSILSKYEERARIIAGGTDIMVDMKHSDEPACLVNLKRIPDMGGIQEDDGYLQIGSLTTIREIETNSRVKEGFPVLWWASHQFASIQIRNTATIGGNVCRASPSGDLLAPLLVLDARAKIASSDGEKTVPLDDFFLGPGKTILGFHAILTAIQILRPPRESRGAYLKHAVRGAMDISIVGVAIHVTPDSTRTLAQDVRIALGAVAPTPIRAKKTEAMLRDRALKQGLINEAARQASLESKPITDHRGSAEYRTWIVEALVRKGLTEAWHAATTREGS